MNKQKWTKPQHSAIYDRGGSLIVSAAAGSGKTAVLVERVIELICDNENPIDITQLLIVTFSNAAAAEMRQRIGERLSKLVSENPENNYLQRQQNLLGSASINTIHGFCIQLIRENFQHLPIAPDFTIADEKELAILKEQSVTAALETFFKDKEDNDFLDLLDQFSSGRDDSKLIETIYKIYNFARSHPFYDGWLNRKLNMYNLGVLPEDTVWGKTLMQYGKETIEYAIVLMEKSRDKYILCDEVLTNAYLEAWTWDISQLKALLEDIIKVNWDNVVARFDTFDFQRLGTVRGENTEKEKCQEARNTVKKLIKDVAKKYLNATSKEFMDDISYIKPKITVLFDLVKSFDKNFSQLKSNQKKLDFSDLEHMALQLLVYEKDGKYVATKEALEISRSFNHVLVDEYQDTNEVQDLLFTSLSNGGKNLFMVGDVKQSIYSFRLAMPEIFMTKKKHFFKYDEINYPATIMLDTNFRSRYQVTAAVNFVFSCLMSENLGDVEYDEAESLKYGANYADNIKAMPEFALISTEDYEDKEDSVKAEANYVANRINQLIEMQYLIKTKDDTMRPVTQGDICIIMRSPKTRAEAYVKVLSEHNITATAEKSSGFLQSREITGIINLLTVLDNPLLEVELIGVMLSPMLNFSDEEITEIRLIDKKSNFYLLIDKAAQQGNRKCIDLLDLLSKLRYYSISHTADELILEIYRLTNWIEIARAMSFGDGRQANLLLLVEYAKHYHNIGYKGLGGFISFVQLLKYRGDNLDAAVMSGDGGNVVKIMSVHRSKGLEFPVVFLVDTGRKFNMQDLNQNVLIHSEQGIASMRRNRENMSQYSTIPRGSVRLSMQKTMLSEELRILYVALTRAKEKLIITGTNKNNLNKYLLSKAWSVNNGKLPSFAVGEQNCYADWIVMALLHHKNGNQLREYANQDSLEIIEDENNWSVSVVTADKIRKKETKETQLTFTKDYDKILCAELEKRVEFVYPNIKETLTPTKLSVTNIVAKQGSFKYLFKKRPKFLYNQNLTPTEKGNALHKFMQFADYNKAKSNLKTEIEYMENNEFLSKIEIESLSLEAIENFFESSLADRIFKSLKVYRELRFITEFSWEELKDVLPDMDKDSNIIVQGIADCVFIEDGKAFIVDYKTDNVKKIEELVDQYSAQLKIYEKIIKTTLNMDIGGSILYSFAISDWILIGT